MIEQDYLCRNKLYPVDSSHLTSPSQSSDAKRIASIFANTDTGRQAQKLNDAMEAQTAPATEDLVIQNGPRKKSKLPLIFALVAIFAVVVGVGGWVIASGQDRTQNGNNTPATMQEAFEEYLKLVKNGPENMSWEHNNNEWFFLELSSIILTGSEFNDYMVTIKNSYSYFFDQNKQKDLEEVIVLHQQFLATLINYYSLDSYDNEMTNKYLWEGEVAAQEYINGLISIDPDQDDILESTLGMAIELERNYLDKKFSILRRYRLHGCIANNEINISCTIESSDLQTRQEEQSAANSRESLTSLFPGLKNGFRKTANAIHNNLEKV